ncbi:MULTISPECIES: glutathione S-transferase N-terminal domain-containing protein [unclassified Sphingomonas]|uniref:glutathione S-transferase N-terminal domain-containing protein n=1 Tax=unclassified Sphingomonas TaxID=196159 RepID=UPI00092A237E|nr:MULTISPECIES: glutathione S-transferase N-terminal domain-containing protein [unclassified Sphingomonas]MBN8848791.1 glutathione S-transferase N-terminal domain-containing protein [Sphingomonas sp.]OJV27306.1 MAG: thiol:disulfide oxidoreductase [Sphingomonas sp. 67-36]
MIDLHFIPSPNGRKVSIMLEEVGLSYNLIPYEILKGDHLTREFRRINPNARLPAIVDHDPIGGGEPLAVFESGAILLYLAEKTGKLLPSAPHRRSQAQQWLMWQMAGLGPMHGQAHHFLRYAPEEVPYAIERYSNEARRLLVVMNRRLGEAEYLAEEYSVADIACWPWIGGIRAIGWDVADYPHIRRWFEAIGRRPAVIEGSKHLAPSQVAGGKANLTPEQWSNVFGAKMLANSLTD